MNWARQLSIIIPVASGDLSWRALLPDLEPLKSNSEILFASTEELEMPQAWQGIPNVRVLHSKSGRAKQMNHAAIQATREVLWFLHSDSRFTPNTLSSLETTLRNSIQGVQFFNLGFFEGPALMAVNTFGVWIRSNILKLPFGDQGFLMSGKLFQKLGRFSETAPYGEDHLLIWKAHEMGVPVKAVPGKMLTSARKYSGQGWWATTQKHLILTFMQGKQELKRIVIKRRDKK